MSVFDPMKARAIDNDDGTQICPDCKLSLGEAPDICQNCAIAIYESLCVELGEVGKVAVRLNRKIAEEAVKIHGTTTAEAFSWFLLGAGQELREAISNLSDEAAKFV